MLNKLLLFIPSQMSSNRKSSISEFAIVIHTHLKFQADICIQITFHFRRYLKISQTQVWILTSGRMENVCTNAVIVTQCAKAQSGSLVKMSIWPFQLKCQRISNLRQTTHVEATSKNIFLITATDTDISGWKQQSLRCPNISSLSLS